MSGNKRRLKKITCTFSRRFSQIEVHADGRRLIFRENLRKKISVYLQGITKIKSLNKCCFIYPTRPLPVWIVDLPFIIL